MYYVRVKLKRRRVPPIIPILTYQAGIYFKARIFMLKFFLFFFFNNLFYAYLAVKTHVSGGNLVKISQYCIRSKRTCYFVNPIPLPG